MIVPLSEDYVSLDKLVWTVNKGYMNAKFESYDEIVGYS